MMTPLRHSGRVPWPRVLQGMAAVAFACVILAPAVIAAEPAGPGDAQSVEAPGATLREVTVSKSPYNTTIQASVDGVIENYNSFKLDDPFRIVVDVWGVAQGTAASEIPVGTPEVKAVKISSVDRKLRMVVETPDDRPMPFIVSAEKGVLVLSVGGGTEGKVTSTERLQDGKAPVKGPAVVGIDLEDLPDASNVVIATAGDPPYQVSRKAGGVTLVFKGAAAEKGLLRRIDARKFDIPVKAIAPSRGKNGVTVAVSFAPGSAYTVEKRDGSVVVAFPKGAAEGKADLVARAAPGSAPDMTKADMEPESADAKSEPAAVEGSQSWGFLTGSSDVGRKYHGQRISMDFKDADLTNVFRIIAEVSNLNIITADDVKGKVSVRLVNVPWDQALDIVLRSKSLGAVQEGNVLRIAPLSSLRKEESDRFDAMKQVDQSRQEALNRAAEIKATQEAVFDTIPVSYSKASELLAKIKPLASKYGRLDSDDRTNVLIIRDLPQNIAEVKALVATLDTATPQVLIEARIVEVDTSFTRELGIQWGGSYRGSSGNTNYGVIGAQDSTGGSLPGGAVTAATTNPFTATVPVPSFAVNLPAAIGSGAGGGIAFGILRDNLRLDLSLSALEASGKGKIISSPKIVTTDNKEATIEQGTQIPYSTVSASGTNTQFIDATLSLKVTPHITPDGRVSMRLEAKNDSQGEVGATGQPAINKKKATTEVLIRDGDTTVIGGILQIERTESRAGLPWLSKIPILGYLFRKDTNSTRNRELLIFITPKILKQEPIQAKAS
ncbi:type IV pilus secretin PilQ [Candidatus Deferrimicrobium sp.]|uniref:type IV pilus secretin PilQ n=1 Tax=Candidatus Deferrimicrobium sp. TaxID=3060586 RepID=UPI002ED972E4